MPNSGSPRNEKSDDNEQMNGINDQYVHYAESAMAVSDRRLQTNRFYISILSSILVVLTVFFDGSLGYHQHIGLLAIGILGVCLCILWYQTIDSHRRLNQAKYEILHNIEEDLPYQVYSDEWNLIGPKIGPEEQEKRFARIHLLFAVLRDIMSSSDKVQYYEQTTVEKSIAMLISILYVLLVVYAGWRLLQLAFQGL